MSVYSDGLPGWLRVVRGANAEKPTTASTTTGGDLDQEPVVVWKATNPLEAEIVKGRLESEGIPALVRGEIVGALYGLTAGSLAETDVLVPAALAQKALEILYPDVVDENVEVDPDVTSGAAV